MEHHADAEESSEEGICAETGSISVESSVECAVAICAEAIWGRANLSAELGVDVCARHRGGGRGWSGRRSDRMKVEKAGVVRVWGIERREEKTRRLEDCLKIGVVVV